MSQANTINVERFRKWVYGAFALGITFGVVLGVAGLFVLIEALIVMTSYP